ncbi:MAG: SHOCT domain-containing protein [Candidatus Brocadiaceae bacterium]|nr:SHOCT domain-containing protein [Candidatus Brocadiaceae bacterium]
MKSKKLKRLLLFAGITCIFFVCALSSIQATVYTNGKVTVEHEELVVKKNGRIIQFSHPYELQGHIMRNVLSEIYFEEKGFLKKKDPIRVFQDDEIEKIVPFVIQALSTATPQQAIIVSSFSDRVLFADQHNYCALFFLEQSLNIAFSRVQSFHMPRDNLLGKKGDKIKKENPVKTKSSRFWELHPVSGQLLEPGHTNWLIIDVSEEVYQQPIAKQEPTIDTSVQVGSSELDSRVKILEERMKQVDMPRQAEGQTIQERISPRNSRLINKFVLLRELVADGIISAEDYDYKKAKLLREAMDDMSIKEQLRELKGLKDEGFITESDYYAKKKELLDQF